MKNLLLVVAFFCGSAFSMDVATALDAKLRAANIPMDGVSIGKAADKTTWKVQFQSTATNQQKTLAATIITNFGAADLIDPPTELQKAQAVIIQLQSRLDALELNMLKLDPSFKKG